MVGWLWLRSGRHNSVILQPVSACSTRRWFICVYLSGCMSDIDRIQELTAIGTMATRTIGHKNHRPQEQTAIRTLRPRGTNGPKPWGRLFPVEVQRAIRSRRPYTGYFQMLGTIVDCSLIIESIFFLFVVWYSWGYTDFKNWLIYCGISLYQGLDLTTKSLLCEEYFKMNSYNKTGSCFRDHQGVSFRPV